MGNKVNDRGTSKNYKGFFVRCLGEKVKDKIVFPLDMFNFKGVLGKSLALSYQLKVCKSFGFRDNHSKKRSHINFHNEVVAN